MGLSVPVRHQYDRVGVWIHTGGLVAGGVHECSNAVSMGAPATGRCFEHVLLPRRWTFPPTHLHPNFYKPVLLFFLVFYCASSDAEGANFACQPTDAGKLTSKIDAGCIKTDATSFRLRARGSTPPVSRSWRFSRVGGCPSRRVSSACAPPPPVADRFCAGCMLARDSVAGTSRSRFH